MYRQQHVMPVGNKEKRVFWSGRNGQYLAGFSG